MDYFEGVVINYLRADRSVFVNTEYCLQINPGNNPDTSGPHWYCDAVALDFKSETIFLCEISYAKKLPHLVKRLKAWHEHWEGVCNAVVRDSKLDPLKTWSVRPWLFIPHREVVNLNKQLSSIANGQRPKFDFKTTELEEVLPWEFHWSLSHGLEKVV
jgi:hypothetical protein